MNPRESHEESRRQLSSQTSINPSRSSTPTSILQTLITFHPRQRILIPVLYYISWKTMRRKSKWLSKGRKSHNETLFADSQSYSWLYFWQMNHKIQIRYIDVNCQIAETLVKRRFHTWRVEQSSSFVQYQPFQLHLCSKNFRSKSCFVMTTRIQEQKEEGVVFKSRLVAMNPSFFMTKSSSSVSSPIVCKSAETSIVSGKSDSRMKINPNSCPRCVGRLKYNWRMHILTDWCKSSVPIVVSRRRVRRLRQSCDWDLIL